MGQPALQRQTGGLEGEAPRGMIGISKECQKVTVRHWREVLSERPIDHLSLAAAPECNNIRHDIKTH